MNSDALAAMVREHADGCTLAVRVQPGAKKTAITGIYGEGEHAALKIAVQAPPVEGRANEALIEFVARIFAIPKSSVDLLASGLSRSKVLGLRSVSRTAAMASLSKFAE